MSNLYKRVKDSIFHTYNRKDLSAWEHTPSTPLPIYGVYHVMLDTGWTSLVKSQIENLKRSGLLTATKKLYVSCIASKQADVALLKQIIDSDKVEIISNSSDPKKYEYPALEYIRQLADNEECLIYYFHSKGISYQSITTRDRQFQSFKHKIDAWR